MFLLFLFSHFYCHLRLEWRLRDTEPLKPTPTHSTDCHTDCWRAAYVEYSLDKTSRTFAFSDTTIHFSRICTELRVFHEWPQTFSLGYFSWKKDTSNLLFPPLKTHPRVVTLPPILLTRTSLL